MAPHVDASLAGAHGLIARAADTTFRLVAREKPVNTKKLTGIICGVVFGVLVIATSIVLFFLHRRRTKADAKEDAAMQMELEGDFDDDVINQPRPARHRAPRTHEFSDDNFKQRQPSVVQEEPNETRPDAYR